MVPPSPLFAATRATALKRLAEFVPLAARYGRYRSSVMPGYPNVSRLSPAIRHRLIDPVECEAAVCKSHTASTVEKFVQELHWRRYWKAWLSLRPQIWDDYRQSLKALQNDPDAKTLRGRVEHCVNGESNMAIMNHFARELTTTGYLHNHARMWFAGWWIHVERLPWQLGADFFLRHLLDADAASNTLSWRWVAGLQTPGKAYLPRRSNIEKYVSPEILAGRGEGIEGLEKPEALIANNIVPPEITHQHLKDDSIDPDSPTGIWIHPEDLRPECGPLQNLSPVAILASGFTDTKQSDCSSVHRQSWLDVAIADACYRASGHFQVSVFRRQNIGLPGSLHDWARDNRLKQVVAIRPEVGPLADRLPVLRQSLAMAGARLCLVNRPEDLALRSFASGGFFDFWKKAQAEKCSSAR